MVAGCEKPASKLSMLDGTTYQGDATPRQVMNVTMIGRYKLHFFKSNDGEMKCSLTLTIHDGLHGWGQPQVTQLKGLTFETEQGLNKDEVVIVRADQCIASAPASIATGQVPDSLILVDANSYEIKLHKVASSKTATAGSRPAQAKIAPTILMPREKFEEIVGKPAVTGEQIAKTFADAFGFSLWDFIGTLQTDEFALPEARKDPIQDLFQANYMKIQAAFNPDYESPWMPSLVCDLSKYGVSNPKPGVWQSDLIHHLWLLTRREGITNLSFAEYKTPDSQIRAFFAGDRLFLLTEYIPARVRTFDPGAWSKRFLQIEGGAPLLVRTNINTPTPSNDAPLDLANSTFASEWRGGTNVSVLGTNYFAQLVSDQPRYGTSSSYTLQLVIGDAGFFYPLTVKDTAERREHQKRAHARFDAERDAFMRDLIMQKLIRK